MTNLMRNTVAILLCLIAADLAAAAPSLVWKFVEDHTTQYRLEQSTQLTITPVEGTKTSINARQTFEIAWHIRDVREDGSAMVELKFERFLLEIDGPGEQSLKYDSRAEQRPEGFAATIEPLLKAITTATYHFTITPQGEIDDVDIPKAVREAASNSPGAAMMAMLTTDAAFKNFLQQTSLILPKTPEMVAGQQWSRSFDLSTPMPGAVQKAKTTYRYEGTEEDSGRPQEVVSMETKLDFGKDPMPGGGTLKVTEQKSTGKALFDRQRGEIESSEVRQTLVMKITPPAEQPGQPAEHLIKQRTELKRME